MTVQRTIVLARSGALLSISPALPAATSFTKYSELDAVSPGTALQIERLLSTSPAGCFTFSLNQPELGTIEVVVVEALAIQRLDCDIVQVVRDSLAPMESQALGRDVSLKFESVEMGALRAKIDPVKIAWVISALVGNSLRFVKSGSRHMPGGSVVVRAAHKRESETLEFKIEDDGPGIPPAVVDEILKQSAGSPPYRGVALRLARDIIQAHGGNFLVYSVEEGIDRGTTIQFTLPI